MSLASTIARTQSYYAYWMAEKNHNHIFPAHEKRDKGRSCSADAMGISYLNILWSHLMSLEKKSSWTDSACIVTSQSRMCIDSPSIALGIEARVSRSHNIDTSLHKTLHAWPRLWPYNFIDVLVSFWQTTGIKLKLTYIFAFTVIGQYPTILSKQFISFTECIAITISHTMYANVTYYV